MKNIYDFTVVNQAGEDVALQDYEGKVLLIVNTATECGFTPQYGNLQELYMKYRGQGLEILDFPCNQFGNQALGSNEEIASFCSGRFGVSFPQFSKIDVNGEDAIPLYQFLKEQKGFAGFHPDHSLTKVLEGIIGKTNPDFRNEPDIKWNFTKFLVDKEGNVKERFEPTEDFIDIEDKIKELL